MSNLLSWLGIRPRDGAGDAVLQIAREVTDRVRPVQSGLAEIRQPAILDALSAQDFAGLDQVIEEQTVEDREYAIVLARLVYAAARSKGFDQQIVDAALRLDGLLPGEDPSRERDRILRDAYAIARDTGYTDGARIALNRIGMRALDAGDSDRARQMLQQQLDLVDETNDTATEIATSLALGDRLRREGQRDEARALYRRAGRSAQRLDNQHAIAEALARQIELLPSNTDLATLAALQRQASEAARRTADLGLQSRIVLGLAETLVRNGKLEDAATQLEQGLTIANRIGDLALEVRCRSALVEIERVQGRLARGAEHERALLSLEERMGNRRAAAGWATRLGSSLLASGQITEAAAAFARGIELAAAAADPRLEQRAQGGLGLALAHLGRPADALEQLSRALEMARVAGDQEGELRWLTAIGEGLLHFQQPDEAARALNDALVLANQIGDTEIQASLLTLLGQLFVARGQQARAREYLGRALELNKKLGLASAQLSNLIALASLAMDTGQTANAVALNEQALDAANKLGDRTSAIRLHMRLAQLATRQRDIPRALDQSRQAVDLATSLKDGNILLRALELQATTLHTAGDPAALDLYRRALEQANTVGDAQRAASLTVNLGLSLAGMGRGAEAAGVLRDGVSLARRLGEPGNGIATRAENALASLGERAPVSSSPAEPALRARADASRGAELPVRRPDDDEVYGESTLPPL